MKSSAGPPPDAPHLCSELLRGETPAEIEQGQRAFLDAGTNDFISGWITSALMSSESPSTSRGQRHGSEGAQREALA